MKKSTPGIIVTIVAIMAIAGVVFANRPDTVESPQSSTPAPSDMANMPSGTADSKSGDMVEDLTSQAEVTMDIKDFAFSKKNIKIKKGTKVTWVNRDSAKHNAFSDDASGPQGQLLAKGESYSFTFNTVGTTNYYCEPHPYMKGIINVVE